MFKSAFMCAISACSLGMAAIPGIAQQAAPPTPEPRLQKEYSDIESRLRSGEQTAESWSDLLDALYRLDQVDKSLAAAQVGAQRFPAAPALGARIARAQFRAGQLDAAAKGLSQSLELSRDPAGAIVLSKLLHAEGNPKQALNAAMLGLNKRSIDAELHYQAGLLNSRLQNHEMAAKHYEQAAALAARSSGYPFELVKRRAEGKAALHRAAGTQPINEVATIGDVPFILPRRLPLPTIDVKLNDRETVRMLLDLSGGPALSLDDDVASRLGLQSVADAAVGDLTGGITPTQWALLPRMDIGACRLNRVATQIYDFAADNLPGIDGIIGAALFSGHRLTMDLQVSRLQVSAARHQPPVPTDPLHTVMNVRFLAGDRPIIPVTIADRDINAIIDIGSPMTCISGELLSALKPKEAIRRSPDGTAVSGSIAYTVGRRTIVPPGTVALPFIRQETSSTLGVQVDMLLGWDLFTRMRTFAFDYPNNQIIIAWTPAKKPGS